MIFETQLRPKAAPTFQPLRGRPVLQRKCACGGTPAPTGECDSCRNKRLGLQTKLAINQPGDRYEQEADRVAASVMNGGSAGFLSTVPTGSVQRDDKDEKQAPPPKPNNYGEAAKKIGDAVQETPFGKQLKAKAEELGKEFLSSIEGKVVAGSALGGALAAIIATNSELPVPIPELPLDFIKPGLKVKITYEGPAQKPTNVGLTLTSGSGVSVSAGYTKTAATPGKPAEEKAGLALSIPLGGSSAKKKPGPSESDKIAAETAQLRDEQAKLREANKTPAEKKADEDFMKSYLHFKGNDPLNPLNIGKKKEDPLLMRSATAAGPATAPPIVHDVLSGGGQPLDQGTRQFMENSLGHDFSRVRIHADARAADSADEVSASAYTVGDRIAFAGGRYAPETTEGRRLLAHELTHVMQQGGAKQTARTTGGVAAPASTNDSPLQSACLPSSRLSAPLGLQRQPPTGGPAKPAAPLPTVDPHTIPESWRKTPLSPSDGKDVYVYRGFARDAEKNMGTVVREGETGGILSRRPDAANDAVFNQYERNPVLSGPGKAGVVRIRIPAKVWDSLVEKNGISERGGYPGFSRQLDSTEIRVNSPEAGRIINGLKKEVLPADPYYDFRPGAQRPARPMDAGGEEEAPTTRRPGSAPAEERPTQPPPKAGASKPDTSGEPEVEAQPSGRGPAAPRGPVEEEHGEAPSSRGRGRGLAGGGDAGEPTPGSVGRNMLLHLGAGVALGLFQAWFKGKVERDLAALPKPQIDRRGAKSFLQDPKAAEGAHLLDLFNKNLKPFQKELSDNHESFIITNNLRLFALALKKDKSPQDLEDRLEELDAIDSDLGEYDEMLSTVEDNLDSILEQEAKALEAKKAADDLRHLLADGFVIDWLFHQGFSVEEISEMDSNLAFLSASIAKLFSEARETKALIEELRAKANVQQKAAKKIWWEEFGHQLEQTIKQRQAEREKAAAAAKKKAPVSPPTQSGEEQPVFRNADEIGVYYGLRTEEDQLLRALESVENQSYANPQAAFEKRNELIRELSRVRDQLKHYLRPKQPVGATDT